MPKETDSQIKERILELEQQRCDALTSSNVAAMERLFSDDLYYVHSSSKVDTKNSYIESMRSGSLAYRAIDRDELAVRVTHGNVAIATGRAKITSTSNGQTKTASIRYTNVWIRKDANSDWQFTNWHAAPVPAPAA
jgi:ketosteroid isomerase-like protein